MPDLSGLPRLRDVIAEHQLQAQKSLGQNFLHDLNLARRIAKTGGPLKQSHVVEIGPGPGALTRALLMEDAKKVTVIEKDERMAPALEAIASAVPGRLAIIIGDALTTDYLELSKGSAIKIVANLPYNISTPLLVKWLTTAPRLSWWTSFTLMFQREVAERIVATPGKSAYGRLSVLANWRAQPRLEFTVPPSAFVPQPKVSSAVVHFVPNTAFSGDSPSTGAIQAVTAAAFGQRRKMLRSSLRQIWPRPEPTLEEAGLDPKLRAENIDVEGYVRLARIYQRSVQKRSD